MSTSLVEALQSVAEQMLADFKGSALIEHRGSPKGTVREAGLRDTYLKRYLPGAVTAVGSGEAVATDGGRSGQQDIMIVHPTTPPLFERDDYRVVPIECLHGAIEVKSNLTVDELRTFLGVHPAIKTMPKTAYSKGPVEMSRRVYGQTYSYLPVAGMVFAYDGASLETLGQAMAELVAEEPEVNLRIDSIWVLNKGGLIWRDHETGQINAQPDPGDDLAVLKSSPQQVLMSMTAHLHIIYGTAFMNPFDIVEYLPGDLGQIGLTWSQDMTNPVHTRAILSRRLKAHRPPRPERSPGLEAGWRRLGVGGDLRQSGRNDAEHGRASQRSLGRG